MAAGKAAWVALGAAWGATVARAVDARQASQQSNSDSYRLPGSRAFRIRCPMRRHPRGQRARPHRLAGRAARLNPHGTHPPPHRQRTACLAAMRSHTLLSIPPCPPTPPL
eukprot:scaffold171852_cov27-Tisochrysis_lutea.AAC.4